MTKARMAYDTMRVRAGKTAAAMVAALILATPAQAGGLISQLWPATDAELGVVDWSGFSAAPEFGIQSFTATGDADGAFGDLEGWTVGGELGYDRQFGRFVAGVWSTGEFAFADANGRGAAAGLEAEVKSYGAIKARLGITAGRFLVYGTGGAAFANVEVSGGGFGSDDQNLSGWLAGGGVEYAWNRGTFLRFEYNRVELEEARFSTLPIGNGNLGLEADVFDFGLVRKF